MYLLSEDAPSLLGLLNTDDDIAFLVSDGPHRWIARQELIHLPVGCMGLWHIPSGPLPLLGPKPTNQVSWISNPFSGWVEQRPGADRSTPYFADHPGTLWLNLHLQGRDTGSICGMSSFEWIGNHYAAIGSPAPPQTARWWRALLARVRRRTRRVPRGALGRTGSLEISAFPAAYRELEAGGNADYNP
jgi:hypothetical protein